MSSLIRAGAYAGFVALCLCFLISPAKGNVDTIRSADRAIWGSWGYSFFNYKEPLPLPYIPDSERGWLPTFAFGASTRAPMDVYLAVDGAVVWGDTIYRGAYLDSPSTPLKAKTSNTIWVGNARVGKGFAVMDAMLTPYAELGFRHWDRDFGTSGVESYQSWNVLGGLMVQYAPTSNMIFTAYGSAGTVFLPTLHYAPYTYETGAAGMYKVGAKIGYIVMPQFEIFTTVDFDFFRYLESQPVSDGTYEPNSRTSETTIRVGVAYHY